VTDGLPRRVRADGEPTAETVTLSEGRRALVTALRRDVVGNERRQQTVAGAAAVRLVATLADLAETAGRDTDRLANNEVPTLLDRAGLSLRVPPIGLSTNDKGLFGFYGYQQAALRAASDADAGHEFELPDDERSRRALGYAGAELVARQRVRETAGETPPGTADVSSDGGDAHDEGGTDDGDADDEGGTDDGDAHDERLRSLLVEHDFDPDADPRETVDWLEDTIEAGRVSAIAARSGEDPRTVREDYRDLRYELNKRIHWLGLDDDGTASDDGTADSVEPEPEAGVLGHDWVSTADRPWSGRSLRGLLYAVLTESDGLALPDDAVDRVELINYGEPTVRAYEVPSDRRDLTLLSGDEPAADPSKTSQFAVDLRIVGDFADLDDLDESSVEAALEQHLNAVQLMARYDEDVREDVQVAVDDHDGDPVATDGATPVGTTEEAAERKERALVETPFDDLIPPGLRDAMDKAEYGWRNGDRDLAAYTTDTEIVATSYSWEEDR